MNVIPMNIPNRILIILGMNFLKEHPWTASLGLIIKG